MTDLLDRYERGDRAAVVAELAASTGRARVVRDLRSHGAAWAQAGGPDQVRRRKLVAATLALELASFYLWPEDVHPLVEWGCDLLTRDDPPDDLELPWQRAAVAMFGRARDDGSLTSRLGVDGARGRTLPAGRQEANHIEHARLRFPRESRFRLAAAMFVAAGADTEPRRDVEWVDDALLFRVSFEARRRARAREAIALFDAMKGDPVLGPEADMRAGYLRLTLNDLDATHGHFAHAAASRDSFVAYLGHFLSGRVLEREGKSVEAARAYRIALSIWPGAMSASTALAANRFQAGSPDEAYAIVDAAMSATPRPRDPWNWFGYGDLRFLPELMADLRESLR